MAECCIKGCDDEMFGQDFCRRHYSRWIRHGHPTRGRALVQRAIVVAPSTTKEYRAWQAMRARCTKQKHRQFADYGGRGILVCDRWVSFSNFLADLGMSPTPSHTLERSDVNGNYEPSNCKWATVEEQNRNTRATRLSAWKVMSAKQRIANGATLADIAREFGVRYHTLWQAVNGVSWANVEAGNG